MSLAYKQYSESWTYSGYGKKHDHELLVGHDWMSNKCIGESHKTASALLHKGDIG